MKSHEIRYPRHLDQDQSDREMGRSRKPAASVGGGQEESGEEDEDGQPQSMTEAEDGRTARAHGVASMRGGA
jgi:hypothetical protein